MEEKYFLRAVYMLDVVPLIDFDKNINLDRELSRYLINILEVFKKMYVHNVNENYCWVHDYN